MPRGEIWQTISRLYHTGRKNAVIVIVERGTATGLRRIPLERVKRVASGYIELDDGTIIPLHRVVRVEEPEGEAIYERDR